MALTPDGAGIWTGEKNPSVPLRPPWPAAGADKQRGKTDWSAEYDAWGNVQRESSPHNMKQLIRPPGQRYDEETGLYYNRHRYYDPVQGRYITQDPIGLAGGWNLYNYPLNPVWGIDPLGLVQFGVRPLGDSSDKFQDNKVPKGDSNLRVAHEQLWHNNSNENIGFFLGDGSGNGPKYCGEAGDVRSNKEHLREQYQFYGPVYDDDIMRQAVNNVTPKWDKGLYCVALQNCQNFADAVRSEYQKIIKESIEPHADPYIPPNYQWVPGAWK